MIWVLFGTPGFTHRLRAFSTLVSGFMLSFFSLQMTHSARILSIASMKACPLYVKFSILFTLMLLVGLYLRCTLEKKGGGVGSKVRLCFLQSSRAFCTISLSDRVRLHFNFRREEMCFELKMGEN